MASSAEGSFAHPPVLSENGKDYEEWKTLTKMWRKFTKFKKTEQGSVLAVKALKGEARSLALSIPEDQLDATDGVETLFTELDKLYLKDKDTLGYECWKKLSTYTKSMDSSILSYCAEFRRLRIEAKKYAIEISDTTFGYMLLDKSNFSDDQKVLILSIALSRVRDNDNITPEDIEAAMRRIQSTSSTPTERTASTSDVFESEHDDFNCIDTQSLSVAEREELVEYAMVTWQNRRNPNNSWNNGNTRRHYGKSYPNSNNRGGYSNNQYQFKRNMSPQSSQDPMLNPRDIQTGDILRCHGCNSRFHLYRSMKCPNNAKVLVAEDSNSNIENIFVSEGDFKVNQNNMTGFGVLDSAATKTVCGKQWFDTYKEYLSSIGKDVKINPSNVCYKFGNDGQKKSLFAAVIPIHIFGQNINLNVDVISSHCPLLMGRPTLEKLGLVLNFKNSTAHINEQTFPLQRSEKGHFLVSLVFEQSSHTVNAQSSYTNEINDIYFLEAEIDNSCEIVYGVIDNSLSDVHKTARKLHLIFGHPPADKLNKTIELGLQGQDKSKINSLSDAIEEYSKSCDRCRELAPHKPKPKVCLPLASKFNEVVAFDITFWNDPMVRKTFMILHFIDLATRLSAAVIINSKEPKHIVDSLVTTWLNVFGAPKRVYTDNGGEFANQELVELMENLGIDFKATAAESSFSNGINERHHAIIKTILDKIRHDYKSTKLGVILSYAIFAKNCLVDNLGFTPHQRVFGHSPNIPTVLSENVCSTNTEYQSDDVRKHLNLLHDTRKAYMTAESSNRIKRALNSRIYTSESPFYYGEHVFYWKESQDKSVKGWKGPGTIIGSEGKVVVIRHGSFIHRCHETKVRRVCEKSALSKEEQPITTNDKVVSNVFPFTSDNEIEHLPTNEITMNNAILIQPLQTSPVVNQPEIPQNVDCVPPDSIPPVTSEAISVLPENTETTSRVYLRPRNNIKPASKWGFDEVYEVVEGSDMKIAKMKELSSWEMHGVYKEIETKDATTPLITTRWVFSTKENDDKSTYLKARLVIRGFQDVDKDIVISESPTAHIESLKVMLALLPTLNMKPKKLDISTAFLQGKSLCRPVFVKPPPEAQVDGLKCWMLLKGAYGLTDAARMWYERVNEVLTHGNYQRSSADPALYFKYDESRSVVGTVLCHVDDFLYSGTESEITSLEQLIKTNFKVRTIEDKTFIFCGFQIEVVEVNDNGNFEIHFSQPGKIPNIEAITIEQKNPSAYANRNEERGFRSVLGALQWHSNSTRPDLAFSVSKLLGETKSLLVKHCILANKLLRKAKANDPNKIVCKKLNRSLLLLNVYTDASFGNLPDLGSQRGSIAFLEDKEKRVNLIEYKSKRIKRVCRSTFSAELLACNAAIDHALFYRSIIKAFGCDQLDINMITDSKSLKDNLGTLVSRCEEKSLRIELAYLREVLSKENIKMKWVNTHEQMADILTKEKPGIDILNILSNN